MRKLLLLGLLAGGVAYAADDDARRCDLAGAEAYDPMRPAGVPFRYFHPLYADTAAMKVDVEACQRAFAAGKDPRYSFQAGNILRDFLQEKSLRRMTAAESPAAAGQLADKGMEQLALGAYRAAADAGYHPARAVLASMAALQPDSPATLFDDVLKDAPAAGHAGLAQWYERQMLLVPERRAQWQAQAKQHWQAALDAGNAAARLGLARILADEGDMVQARALLQQADAQDLYALDALALFYFKTGETAAGEQILAGVQQRADAGNADARVFADYWRGLRLLNGWGMAHDEAAAIAALQAAARGGHQQAQFTLMGMKRPW